MRLKFIYITKMDLISPSEWKLSLESKISVLNDQLRLPNDVQSLEEELTRLQGSPIETVDLTSLTLKDNQLSIQIDLCNRLWVLKGFIDQIVSDLEMNEFESIFYNLHRLDSKLQEFDRNYTNSLIIDKIGLQMIEFEKTLDANIDTLINEKFWNFSDDSILFYYSYAINEYTDLTYLELNEILTSNYDAHTTPYNKRLVSKLNLNGKIDSDLVQPLINGKFDLDLELNDHFAKLTKIEKSNSIFNYLNSLINCVKFIDTIPNNTLLQKYVVKPILSSLEKKLLEDNIELLISDSRLKELSLELSTLLETNQWFQKGENTLKNWVNDSINYWIDKKFKDSLLVLQKFKQDLYRDSAKFDKLQEVVKEDWSWNDDDEQETKLEVKETDDAWDDAWGDDEDLFSDEEKEKESTKISDIPQKCYDTIISPFLKLSSEIKEFNIEGLLILRLKDLLTDIFIVLSDLYEISHRSILFYNDFEHLLELVKQSEIAQSLKTQLDVYLESIGDTYQFQFMKIWNSSIKDFQNLEDEDNLQDQEIFLVEFENYMNDLNGFIKNNYDTNSKLTNSVIVSDVSFLLEFMTRKVFQMQVISETLSNQISNFQKDVIKLVKKIRKVDVTKLAEYNKFVKVSKILTSNLKTIETDFSDGVFFDFETSELIDLIKLLFIDSEYRAELIEYITDIRTEE